MRRVFSIAAGTPDSNRIPPIFNIRLTKEKGPITNDLHMWPHVSVVAEFTEIQASADDLAFFIVFPSQFYNKY